MGIDCYPYTTKDIKRLKFFRTGFYISLVIWMCGISFAFSEASVMKKIVVIVVTLGIYLFFVIGKSVMEEESKRYC